MAKEIRMGREVFNIPFGDIIREVAMGIADAQFAFDKTSMLVAEQMAGRKVLREAETGEPILDADGKAQTVPTTVFFGYDLRILGTPASANLTIEDDETTTPATKGTVKLSQLGEDGNPDANLLGSKYDYAPTVRIEGDGRGATAKATLNTDGTVSLEIEHKGAGYTDAKLIVEGGKIPKRFAREVSMIELGFVPNFYQFVDTVIEMKLALRVNKTSDNKYQLTTSTVDANYASSYNYSLNMATIVKTKIVPIPPPAILEDRIQQLLEANREVNDAESEEM